MRFGATGPNNSSVTACAAGAHSIGEAFHTIVRGAADVMIAGGTEAVITPLAVVPSATCGRCHRMRRPLRRPVAFDRERDGFVMAEGPVRSSWKNCNMPVVVGRASMAKLSATGALAMRTISPRHARTVLGQRAVWPMPCVTLACPLMGWTTSMPMPRRPQPAMWRKRWLSRRSLKPGRRRCPSVPQIHDRPHARRCWGR